MYPAIRASDGERGGRGDLIQAIRGNENTHFKLWPTPRSNDAEKRGSFDLENLRNGLAAAVKLWPTPCTPNGGRVNRPEDIENKGTRPDGRKVQVSLESAVKMIPTPCSIDHKTGACATARRRDKLWEWVEPTKETGSLNPNWVCWLMGWPTGWTALGPLNPQAFREWLQAFKIGWQD